MATLSVVLATFNEEKNLARCLDSVKDFAREVVIVDGTSTDRTVEIARQYGARVEVTTNPQVFHINKQKAIDLATSDWILQLDADEVVSPELKQEIKEVIDANNVANGYWMPRKNWFLGRFLMKGGQYPDYTIRLYRKGMGKVPQKDVHEQAEIIGEVAYLKSPLLHYPYKDFKHYLTKWDRYVRLTATQLVEQFKDKASMDQFILGVEYVVIRPIAWFVWTYGRHKGFMDGWQGFVFSAFSALRYPMSFVQYILDKQKIKNAATHE